MSIFLKGKAPEEGTAGSCVDRMSTLSFRKIFVSPFISKVFCIKTQPGGVASGLLIALFYITASSERKSKKQTQPLSHFMPKKQLHACLSIHPAFMHNILRKTKILDTILKK